MKEIGLIIDSTVSLPKDLITKEDIEVVSLLVTDNENNEYKEKNIDRHFIVSELDKGKTFKTSQPAPTDFIAAYNKQLKKYMTVFYLGISKGLSGTYQAALLAKNMCDKAESIHVLDTNMAAYGSEMLAYEMIDMIHKKLSVETIKSNITSMAEHSELLFTVENLFSLVRGGRLSHAKAILGTVLRIKPIIKMIDGELKLVNKERTYKKVFNYFLETITDTKVEQGKLKILIIHENSYDAAKKLFTVLNNNFPKATITMTNRLSPVMTIHVGLKGFGISWFYE
ncbi:MAG: DegV family protein [Candidatus Izimaplasma sp.]|nr:DegV family protein [Candidatus Izimaplasma bacterium]